MTRRQRNLLLVLLSLLGVVSAVWYWGSREPVLDGKSASEWLADLDAPQPREVRSRASNAISRLGVKAVPAVLRSLEREDSSISRLLATAVGHPLRDTTSEEHRKRAFAALKVLGSAAVEARPVLAAMLQRGQMPSAVARAITAIDPAGSVGVLNESISHTNLAIRRAAVWALSGIASNAEPAIPRLVGALADSDPSVRGGAAHALGRIRKRLEITVPALASGLTSTNWEFRYSLLLALQELGADAKAAVPAIRECFVETNGARRAVAAVTLWYVDRPSAERAGFSTEGILKMLEPADGDSRRTALVAPWMLQDMIRDQSSSIVAATAPCLADTNLHVRQGAVTVLRAYGQGREDALAALAGCINDSDTTVRRAVTNAIVALAPNYFVRTNR